MTDTSREAFEAWALPIRGDNATWKESGECELAWRAWDASRKQAQSVEPVAWVFLPNRELLWPDEVEATNPIAIDEYKPLYAHPVPPVQQVAVPATDSEIYTAYIAATNQTLRPQDERLALKFARAIEAHHKIGAKP